MEVNEAFWKWVEANLKADPAALRLKYHGRTAEDFDLDAAIRQVECRQRFGKKLHETLAINPRFFFPTELSGEQCTSDALAAVHSSLIPEGARLVDLTAGLGIDAIHCEARCSKVTAIERNPAVAEALKHNAPEIDVVNADCRVFVRDYKGEMFDVAFIDPARRAADGSRVYGVQDCEPDVIAMLPDIARIAGRLIVKLSPMLDISSVLSALPATECLMVLGTTTECKELVADLRLTNYFAPSEAQTAIEQIIRAVTIGAPEFSFTPSQKASATATYAEPEAGQWLYEPFPAVMKTGAYDLLSQRYGVAAIAPNTHVFLSSEEVEDFPGARRKIVEVVPYISKNIKRLSARYPRLEVAVRNFPITAEALAHKLKVRQGSDLRLIAVTTRSDAPVMIISR